MPGRQQQDLKITIKNLEIAVFQLIRCAFYDFF